MGALITHTGFGTGVSGHFYPPQDVDDVPDLIPASELFNEEEVLEEDI